MTLSKNLADQLSQLTDKQLVALLDTLGTSSEGQTKLPINSYKQTSGRKVLVAYYLLENASDVSVTTDAGEAGLNCTIVDGLDEKQLRNYCQSKLPAHLCPTRLVALNRLPVLPNGKLSYSHLPIPQQAITAQQGSHDAAVTTESAAVTRMVAILAEILDMTEVRSDDNFFEIGGDSITAIQFLSKARQSGLAIDLAAISQSHTIADMAALCEVVQPDRESDSAAQQERSNKPPNFSASGFDGSELDDFLQSFD